jgi:hypothetical protein
MSQSAIPQILKFSLFALGLFAYTGIFLHQGSVYLWAIIFPAIALKSKIKLDARWFAVGVALVGCWLVFPLTNFLNFMVPHPAMLPEFDPNTVTASKLMKSLFPATWIGSGLMLAFLSSRSSQAVPQNDVEMEFQFQKSLKHFWMGFCIATVLFGVYFTIQHLWGIDFRGSSRFLGNHNRMGAQFRVPGFYGHPLTLGAIALAWSSFFVWLGTSAEQSLRELSIKRSLCWVLASLNFAFVLMSGGRIVGVLCLMVWSIGLIRWACREIRQRDTQKFGKWIWLGSFGFLAVSLTAGVHLSHRVIELFHSIQSRGLESIERVQFWRVYWQIFLDSLWFGQGEIYLRSGLRESYYQSMGLGNFHQKYNAHNFVIEILACTGLVGFGLITGFLGLVIRRMRELVKLKSSARTLAGALALAFGANMLHGVTQNTLFDASLIAAYANMFWLVVWTSGGTIGRA